MTVPSTQRKAGPFNGNGSATSFAFTFKVFATSDIKVTTVDANGIETVRVLSTDYSVTLNPNQETSPGGTVTYPLSGSALAVGQKLSITGNLAYDQPLDLPSGGNFSPIALENELDRTIMQVQQLEEKTGRALLVPVTASVDTDLPQPEARKIIGWDVNGTGMQNYDIPDLFSGAVYADWVADTYTGNGTQTVFILQRAPGSVGNCDVSVDGQTYVPNVDFTLSGNTLAFTVAPINGSEILVRYGSAATQVASTFSTETQTATAGQTVFNLTSLLYTPGANTLAVYVNGLRLVAGVDYLEVDNNTINMTSGLQLNDEVLFVAGRTINDGVGAESVSFLPAGTGAVARTAQAKLRETVSVKDFGAVGDGVTDDTAAIQAAVTFARLQGGESRKLYWPRGTYLITNTITLGTNQTIEFDPGVTVNFVAADPLNTPLFVAANQSEVYLNGNGAVINGTRGTVAGQGTGTAFFMYGSDNITIRNFVITNFATDGIELTGDNTGSGPCTNVLIENCTVDNCRRNGMSIISVIGCTVIGGLYTGTNGALGGPWAGIDVEPNSDCFLENVNLIGVTTGNNDGAGIQFTPGALSSTTEKRYNVFVTGGRSINDGDLVGVSGLYFANGGAITNKVYGEVIVRGFTVENPKSRGVNFREWDADKCPRAIVEDVTVYNPDATSSAVSNVNRTGFVIYADSTQATTNLGNIVLRNCLAEDLRGSPRMTWGMIEGAEAGKVIKNVLVENPTSINTVASNKFDIYTSASEGAGSSTNTDVVYFSPQPVSISAGQSIAGFGGKRINATSSSNNFTLPLASTCSGMAYEVQTAPAVNSVGVVPQTGDTIAGVIGVASTSLVLDEGGFVRLRSRGGTTWYVEAVEGKYRIAGTAISRQIQWATAAPTTGTWLQGDRVFNQTATVGQPKSWVCTVGGTPGTWVSEGNL